MRPNAFPWKEIVLAISSTVVFLAVIEGMLALAGVQSVVHREDPFVGFSAYSPLFVRGEDLESDDHLITATNKRQLFNVQSFSEKKPQGTYRIFCLGGSTTYGRPYTDATSFAGWLRELLPIADPSRDWEVINAGGISYASYRVAALMEELAEYEPDLFVIYTGHNEFLEERTYGTLRDMPRMIRTSAAALARTRTWAAMRSILQLGQRSPYLKEDPRYALPMEVKAKLDRSAGLDLYERDDQLRRQVLEHYRVSLHRMVDIAREGDAQLVFVTPASNLRSFSPFKSQHTNGLSEAGRSRSDGLLRMANQHLRDSRWAEALEPLDEALMTDSRSADLHYARGQALYGLRRYDEAQRSFERARDEDVCPLRALSAMRQALVEVARETDTPLVDFVDIIQQRLRGQSGHSIPGDWFFLDHVHPTIEGHRILAIELVREMAQLGIVRLGSTWDETAVREATQRVEGGIDRAAHGRALAQLAWTLDWAGKEQDSRRLAVKALAYEQEDPPTLLIVARHEAFDGDTPLARELFLRALRADPLSPTVYYQYGLFLADLRELEAAAANFLRASVLWPQDSAAHLKFGLAMAERGRLDIALPALIEAQLLNPGDRGTQAKIDQVQEILGSPKSKPIPCDVSISRYLSGNPRVIAQTRPSERANPIAHGAWTEWYDTGELKSFVDYVNGVPKGVRTSWSINGDVVTRIEEHQGQVSETPPVQ